MKGPMIVRCIWLCMVALVSVARGGDDGVSAPEIDPRLQTGIRVVDLSKVPVLRGRGPEMRAVLDRIMDEEYCGDAMMEGVTQAAALCGQAPVEGLGFVKLADEDWPPVLLGMADEEFERLSKEGKLNSLSEIGRLWNMIELLGTTRGDATDVLAFFQKMAKRAEPEWESVLFLAISGAWIDQTIEKEGVAKCLELNRVFEMSCGIDSWACGIFFDCLGRHDAFARCKTPEELAVLSRFVLETAERCKGYGHASMIDDIAAGEAYYHLAKDSPDPFALGGPKMGVPGWKGSLQRKRLAERFRNEPVRGSSYQLDEKTGERIWAEPTQRDINLMLWSRAASELATDDSELTDLREVYGDWSEEKTIPDPIR